MPRLPLCSWSTGRSPRDAALPPVSLEALEALLGTLADSPTPGAEVRVIVESQPGSGAWNMAVDETLLEAVAAGAPPTLRLYTWTEATISLGYFQREAPELEPGGRFHGLPVVQRLSGGGAILHHQELTYSCCIPGVHPLAGEPARLYDELHRQIRQALAELGALVEPRGIVEGDDKPFLCFARGDRRDLLCRGFKVVGSAQRRRRRAVLQHGSILLRRSPFLPEFPGLLDLEKTEVDESRLARMLARHCARVLGTSIQEGTLTPAEQTLARHLTDHKYAAATKTPSGNSSQPASPA
jgi:lipoate-protein ligase A